MRKVESAGRRGIRWTLTTQLSTAQKIVLKASITKTKHTRMNSRTNEPIKLQEENIEEVEEFTYLGSKMTADGSSEREIRARLLKAGQPFATLRNTWKSGEIFKKMRIRLFKSNVLSILLYGSESWKMTKAINHRFEVFQNRCLCKMLKICITPSPMQNSTEEHQPSPSHWR